MAHTRGALARKFRGNNPRKIFTNTEVAELQREALKETYGDSRSAAKRAADDAAASPRAAENWLAGENPMGLTAFLNAYHNNGAFRAWAKKLLLLEQELDPEFEAQMHAFIRAAQKLGAAE